MLTPNHNNVSKDRAERMKEYWLANPGKSARQIAREFNVVHSTVTYWIRMWKSTGK
ncbi:helix-turn-helix domain-containing protein [Vibrio vulnificus]|uniref:helix-turn-helix domain-containing protein n=1 Tax=Vibrio vulnificus TaxID=672 RepID=UPI0039B68C2F